MSSAYHEARHAPEEKDALVTDAELAPGLSRETVIEAALDMLDSAGVEGLSMRALAERLGVKAASLYWHFRDKDQLLDTIAETVLARFTVRSGRSGWREAAAATCEGLAGYLAEHRAVAAVLLRSLPTVQQSSLTREIAGVLTGAGSEQAQSAAFSLIVEVIASAVVAAPAMAAPDQRDAMTLAIDSGSWRVTVRAAPPGALDVARSLGGGGAATIDVEPEGRVVLRNRRGGNRGAVELNRDYTWYVKLHGGTWQTTLDLRGLRISGIEMDSGAGKVTCTLPLPVGVVPIRVNSGIMGVTLHRPRDAAVHATLSSGSVKLRFDDRTIRTVLSDATWDTPGALRSDDRYELTVHSGCMNVTLDAGAPVEPLPLRSPQRQTAAPVASNLSRDAVQLILDGVERRRRT